MKEDTLLKVRAMHEKFKISPDDVAFTDLEKDFRIEAMQEELDEYAEATSAQDEFDALIDLLVFTLGTIDRQGWSPVFYEGFCRVMDANLKKELGPNIGKRGGFQLDLFKPEDWQSPDHSDLVG